MKNTKGITLIALIITVIVMLILISVSLSTALNTGLFKSAGEATKKWGQAQNEEENPEQAVIIGGKKYSSIEDYLSNKDSDVKIRSEIEDGVSLLRVATQAISESIKTVTTLNELVVQYVNSYSSFNIEKIQEQLDMIDSIANTTAFNNEILLNGSLNRAIGINEFIVHIENLNSTGLDLAVNDGDLSTVESLQAYLEKIEQAKDIMKANISKVSAVLSSLAYLDDYYKAKETLINSNPARLDKELAKLSLSKIKQILARDVELIESAGNTTNTANETQACKDEIEALLIAIDYISNDTTYGDKKLLDGTFENISEINTTTLGGSTKLRTDVLTQDSIEDILNQYQNAIKIVENELTKLQ